MLTSRIQNKPFFVRRCKRAWDGDTFGHEWKCGAAVYRADTGGWEVYEDDGAGNGNALEWFSMYSDAEHYAKLYCQFLDEGGFAGSETHRKMCRLAQERGSAQARLHGRHKNQPI